MSTQVALLTKQAQAIFTDDLRFLMSLLLAAGLSYLLLRVYPRTQRQLRLREVTVFEHLSPELQAVWIFFENPFYRSLPGWRDDLRRGMQQKRNEANSYLKGTDFFFTLVPLLSVVSLVIYHALDYFSDPFLFICCPFGAYCG